MRVEIERVGQVGRIHFGDAQNRSKWSPAAETAYFDALDELEQDSAVRAIVLTGAGTDFCAGPEFESLDANVPRDERSDAHPLRIAKPIVAAIEGHCLGIGLSMALMCDIRVVASNSKLTAGFASVGLVAEHGVAWHLQRLIGIGCTMDFLLGDFSMKGSEAMRIGLAQREAEDGHALEIATEVATRLAVKSSPLSMALIKRQVHLDATSTLAEAMELGEAWVQKVAQYPDFADGVKALKRGEQPRHSALNLNDFWQVMS